MVEPILHIRNLSISFSTRAVEIPAVMDFSCQVMPGEAMGLVGESGCGKSTVALAILRDLARIGRITSGSIHFNGRDMAKLSEHELRQIRGSEIAMVYQEPVASLNPTMKIGRQLTEVLFIHEMVTKEQAYARALDMVKAVKLPDPERIMGSYPHQLSGGQQQRIVIAMALLAKPKLLILDEPTTALDVTVEAGIVELVKELGKKFGTSMLFISHNLGLILETCDRVTVMYSGEAVESGPIRDVFGSVRHPYTQGLFRSMPLLGTNRNSRPLIPIPGQLPLPHERPKGCHFGPRCSHFVDGVCNVSAVAMRSIDEAHTHHSRCMRVSEIDWHAPPEAATQTGAAGAGPELLNVKGLKKYYKAAASELFGGREARTVKAVEEVNFTAREAETLAIVGESGCGKSTLAKVLLGLETATEGTARYDETEIQSDPIERRDTKLISSIQMIFQNPFDTLNPSYSVGSQIIRTLERFGIGASREERSEMMLNLLDLVKLPRAFATRMPRQLSGGQKQRIGVARAFAGHPRMIIADEPMSALDVSVQAAITELLTTIQRQSRTTMVLISHDLSLVRYMADRIIVMYLGHIVEQGTAEQIFAPPYHPYTEALLSAIPLADSAAKKRKIVLEGEIPSALSPPSGCPFQTRCHMKSKVSGSLCEQVVPPMRELKDGHAMKCHLPIEILDQMTPVIS
jgi:peptide/nickel transport system ATP-binding protein